MRRITEATNGPGAICCRNKVWLEQTFCIVRECKTSGGRQTSIARQRHALKDRLASLVCCPAALMPRRHRSNATSARCRSPPEGVETERWHWFDALTAWLAR
jgi:hypothetical protein